jgi:hypothetical protein
MDPDAALMAHPLSAGDVPSHLMSTALCIATRFKARAYPMPVVFTGNLI